MLTSTNISFFYVMVFKNMSKFDIDSCIIKLLVHCKSHYEASYLVLQYTFINDTKYEESEMTICILFDA